MLWCVTYLRQYGKRISPEYVVKSETFTAVFAVKCSLFCLLCGLFAGFSSADVSSAARKDGNDDCCMCVGVNGWICCFD